eukprot:TRINITY_DN3540_c0_g1_i1.p1 TRINITY_DN3540_c0_g1~~TRINITY_DN3540_c0_g1_i1.p1  ORF type:complete len:146 (+),score=26.91 TRINITY_DN3540_c0_g1_i1:1135-1572(+)
MLRASVAVMVMTVLSVTADLDYPKLLADEMTTVAKKGIEFGYGKHPGSKLLEADLEHVGKKVAYTLTEKLAFYKGDAEGQEAEEHSYRLALFDMKRDVFDLWPVRRTLSPLNNGCAYTMLLYLQSHVKEFAEEMQDLLDDDESDL